MSRAKGHVVMSETETTRPVERPAVAPVAKLFPLGKGASHPFLEPATASGPFFPHCVDAKNYFGGVTVTDADMTGIECDERITQEEALA